jgi:hypothetical protein
MIFFEVDQIQQREFITYNTMLYIGDLSWVCFVSAFHLRGLKYENP